MMGAKMTGFFQLPNAVVDDWLMLLSGSAIKVYLAVVRKTRGWQKAVDLISLSQFGLMTGLSRPTVSGALDELLAAGLITVDRGQRTCAYRLNDAALLVSPWAGYIGAGHEDAEDHGDDGQGVLQTGKFFACNGKKTYQKMVRKFATQKDNKINLRKKSVASDLPRQQDLNLDAQEQPAVDAVSAPRTMDQEMQSLAGYREQSGGATHDEQISNLKGSVAGMPASEEISAVDGGEASASIAAPSTAPAVRLPRVHQPARRWRIQDAAVPEGVSLAVWQQYLAVRHSGRNRLDTQHKYFNLINKLDQLRASGQDVNCCLDQSQQESWLGVFALKSGYVASRYVAGSGEHTAASTVQAGTCGTAVGSGRPAEADCSAVPKVKVLDRAEAAKRCQELWRLLGGGVRHGMTTAVAA